MLDPIKRTVFNGYLRNGNIDALDINCFEIDTPSDIVNDSYILKTEQLANGDYHFLILHENKFKHFLYSGNPNEYRSVGHMYNIDRSLFFKPLAIYLRSMEDGLITLDEFLTKSQLTEIKNDAIILEKWSDCGNIVLYNNVILRICDDEYGTEVGYVTK